MDEATAEMMRHAYNWLLDDGMSESELEASLAKFGLCKEDIFAKRQRMGDVCNDG